MGSMTVNPVTALISGGAITETDTGGSTSTITIDATTAQSVLDFSKLSVYFENYSSTASCAIRLNYGDDFSEVGQGHNTSITLATAGTAGDFIVIGGTTFESARFQDSDGEAEFTITTAGTVYVWATMLPSP